MKVVFGIPMRTGARSTTVMSPLPRKVVLPVASVPQPHSAKHDYHNDLSSHFGNSVLQLRTFALVGPGMG